VGLRRPRIPVGGRYVSLVLDVMSDPTRALPFVLEFRAHRSHSLSPLKDRLEGVATSVDNLLYYIVTLDIVDQTVGVWPSLTQQTSQIDGCHK